MQQTTHDSDAARTRAALEAACARVSRALRTLAAADSVKLGTDCYRHAELGRALLWDLGFKAQCVTGFAAWRVGCGSGDVISHTPPLSGQAKASPGKRHYHSWLNFDGFIVDFTTYTLTDKARALDATDGGHTTVTWCPPFLVLAENEVHRYRAVANAMQPGAAYYLARPELELQLPTRYALDPQDLQIARRIANDPQEA